MTSSPRSEHHDRCGRRTVVTGDRPRALRLLLVALMLGAALTSCSGERRGEAAVVVASADSPEQVLLGTLTVQALKAGGHRVVDKTSLGSPWVVRRALEAGNADLWWEYAGDTWAVHLAHDRPISDPAEVYERVREEDAARGITWLPPAPCLRTMGLVMAREEARSLHIASIGDLAGHVARVDPFTSLCTPEGWYGLAGGVRGIERVYGMRFSPKHLVYGSIEEGYARAARGECLCAVGYSLDAGPIAHDLVALADDRGYFQASNLAVAVRTPVLEALPDLEEDLMQLGAVLTREAMTGMLHNIVVDGEKPEAVAKRFLGRHDLLRR